jgi:ankyrin repeat protein
MTPLICAVKIVDLKSIEKYKMDVIQLLLEHGADINGNGGKQKRTPLIYAIMYENVAIVKYLTTCGADVNQSDAKNKLPIDYAFDNLNKKILKQLKK